MKLRTTVLMTAIGFALAGCLSTVERADTRAFAGYSVRDPMAGYFDFDRRRQVMTQSQNADMIALRNKIAKGPSCSDVAEIPIQDDVIVLPTFYGDNAGWRKAVRPFWDIENAVSKLAAAHLVAKDSRYGDCLVSTLMAWAKRDALSEFEITDKNKQSWFQIESTLFAMALALAAVRPDLKGKDAELRIIDQWMVRASKQHLSIEGGDNGTCCNNHFYRRALHGTIIGVMANNDELFQVGVDAVRMAVTDATSEGALPLEMQRGDRAAHYQNYALMYLVMIAEIIERQGYPAFDVEIDGKTLHTLIDFNNRLLYDPEYVTRYSDESELYLGFREDPQYFAWFEIYLRKYPNPLMESWADERRPLYNRSLGGHLTAYFYNAER